MNDYLIFDGRAHFDVDQATVLECFQSPDDRSAKEYFHANYDGIDCVLMDANQDYIDHEV